MPSEKKSIVEIIIVGVVCLFGEIIVTGLSMEFIRLFKPVRDPGVTFLLTVPLLGVAWISSQSQDEDQDGGTLTVRIFVFATALSIVFMIGHWLPIVAWLAVFGFFYGKKVQAGYHYLFVTQPIVVEAKRAEAEKDKLDADSEVVEATIRRERARAALLDAEREVEEAKTRAERTQ